MAEERGWSWSELARLPMGATVVDAVDGSQGYVDVHDCDGMKYIQWDDGRYSVPLCRLDGPTTIEPRLMVPPL